MTEEYTIEPGVPEAAALPVPKEMQIADVVALVAEMNLFLSRLANMTPFKDSQITVADWLVLNLLIKRQPTIPRLAKMLGIAPPRVKSIVDKLKSSGLVVGQTSESESETIALAPDGQARLDGINAELRTLFDGTPNKFSQGLAGRDKSFFAVAKNLKYLLRMVAPPATEAA
jgi:DNA-binding MarR family transcriptional regulator